MPVPASRDRLSRPVDISDLLPGATRRVNLIVDEPGLQRVGLSGNGFRNGSAGGFEADGSNNRARQNQQRGVVTQRGGGGNHGGGRERRRRSQLPSWHPRTPLRDITGILRAIERRRAELGLNQDNPQQANNATNTQPELESTPSASITVKPKSSHPSQLWRVKVYNENNDSDSLTPQKKLLESIEKVREVWQKEQRKQEKTPAAKRAERGRKVRVLMSMR